jgi:hypothetical protein
VDLWPFDHPVLHRQDAERLRDGEWRSTGGGGYGTCGPEQILVEQPSGLHKLGGGSRDPVCLTSFAENLTQFDAVCRWIGDEAARDTGKVARRFKDGHSSRGEADAEGG